MGLLELNSFLKRIKPFSDLEKSELEEISSNLDILYFKENVTILDQNSKLEFLYFIIKGVVQEKEDQEIISGYTSQEFFDPISLIENKVKHQFVTLQETICYALPKEIFLKIVYQNEQLERYFFSSISEKLNISIQNKEKKKLLDFATSKVEDAYLQKPVYINEDETIINSVKICVDKGVQAALIRTKEDKLGIVTHSSFVKKVLYENRDINSKIGSIATYDLKYIDASDFLFNAQLMMAKHSLKRLVVKKDEKVIGLLDIVSLSSFFASHTHSTSRSIEDAVTVEELKEASSKFIRTIRALYEKGVKVRHITKLVSALNNKLFRKLFELTAPKELLNNSCLIIMGSEGRGEQILRTDQDNALILKDGFDIDESVLKSFTEDFTKNLLDFGYPLCEGNIMVSNPYWVKNVSQFKDTIFDWINKPDENGFMNLAIFYDALSVGGDETLLKDLKNYLFKIASSKDTFYSHFSKPTLMFETPLGFFSDFIVDNDKHKDELDIKKGGIFPIVHGIRSLAVQNGITQTNTVERIKELNKLEVLDDGFSKDIAESFNYLLTLRLKFRLLKIDSRSPLDNYIKPLSLSMHEKDLLKDSFKTVNKFKKFISYHYKLNLM